MDRINQYVDAILRVVIVASFSVLVACVVWQVFTRYVLATPSTITDEMARFLFIWVGLIGAAYTLGQRRHLAINLLGQGKSPRFTRPLDLLLTALIALFAGGVMVYGGGILALETLARGQVSPSMRIPMGYIYMAIPFAGLIKLYYCAIIVRDILGPEARGPNEDMSRAVDDEAPDSGVSAARNGG